MIRWYDYPIVFLTADFLWINIKIALFGGTWMSVIGALGAYSIWYSWNELYLPFRVKQENER